MPETPFVPEGCELVADNPPRYLDQTTGEEFYLCPRVTPEGLCQCVPDYRCDGRMIANETNHGLIQGGGWLIHPNQERDECQVFIYYNQINVSCGLLEGELFFD